MSALLVSVSAFAQQNATWKRLESNFQLGGGLFLESGYLAREENPGAVLRLSYGLDIRLDDQWSVMPGVGLRAQARRRSSRTAQPDRPLHGGGQ